MSFEHEALLNLTREQFPALRDFTCKIEPIVKGGSDRHFYRLIWADGRHDPMILMVYTMARRDNPKFVPATRRLAQLHVNVPSIQAFDEHRLCVWLDDLGRVDLHSFREQPWSIRAPLYEVTLEEVAKIHRVGEDQLARADHEELEPEFDEALYGWEQNYFLEHYVHGFLGRSYFNKPYDNAHQGLRRLRRRLARLPRCLVHRDFQSQNVLIQSGAAWFVDYQGLRLGLAEYDLASLLYDPYVNLTRTERNHLLRHYAKHRDLDINVLTEIFHLCAAQRLMQALGAYANLSRNLGKPHFEQHIPTAVTNLTEVCEEVDILQELRPLFV